MKHFVHKIDASGLFVEDVILDDDSELAPNLIAEHVPGGFYWPKWNGAKWVEGGTAPAPQVPTVVSMRQARLALYGAGLLDDVEAAVAGSTKDVQIEWEFSSELRRDWPTLVLLAGALGLTEAQLDALFIQASQL